MPLRIVAVADTHTFERDFAEVPEGDVFVHAGDLCRAGTLDELRKVAQWITALPHRDKVIVPGNHDWAFVRAKDAVRALLGPSVTVLEDSGVTIGGARFWGSPWQPAFHNWAYNLPRGAALAEKWALIPEGVDVLITHGPPEGIGDRSSTGGRKGCADLRERVRVARPKLHLFGHIHEDGGCWTVEDTVFANVTTWECERAPSVFDLDAAHALPVSIPPRART
jgi:Icc-related predicted phosphoesterase